MRFLIDECLSVDLVSVANRAGQEAQHVAHIGNAGWKDWNVAAHARSGDFILVTNNASDFRRLYSTEPLHAGLIIIIPNVGRTVQQWLFSAVLAELSDIGEPVNLVLEVDLDGDEAISQPMICRSYTRPPRASTVSVFNWPQAARMSCPRGVRTGAA